MQGVFGFPPSVLVDVPHDAVQFSPLVPGASALEAAAPESFERIMMLAPAGTIERRYALANALLALKSGGELVVMALNKKGGTRLFDELQQFGCDPVDDGRHHHRICECTRPALLMRLQDALEAGAMQKVAETGLWSQAGVFSWNKMDVGSQLLAQALPPLSGRGADLGAGIGFLSLAVLGMHDVQSLSLVEIDRRALAAAKRNIADSRATFLWQDARACDLKNLDFVVMNPPFHEAGMESQPLGQAFIHAASDCLRTGGVCYLVANRHLPYEAGLREAFTQVRLLKEAEGFKVFEARK